MRFSLDAVSIGAKTFGLAGIETFGLAGIETFSLAG
jgi:hypothetical protein